MSFLGRQKAVAKDEGDDERLRHLEERQHRVEKEQDRQRKRLERVEESLRLKRQQREISK